VKQLLEFWNRWMNENGQQEGFDPRLNGMVDVFRSLEQFNEHMRVNEQMLTHRWLTEQRLPDLVRRPGRLFGWNELIEGPTEFEFHVNDDGTPASLREGLVCSHTRLPSRIRAGLEMLMALSQGREGNAVYLTEQATPAFGWLKSRFPNARGSEFFEAESRARLEQAMSHHGLADVPLEFQDITRLDFPDAGLDAVLSFDVLEHVPDYHAALAELARVLRRDGHLILTAPFLNDRQDTLVRATIDDDGNIVHHLEPEYHGDPLRPDGVLAFQTFGWDLLDAVRQAGYRDAVWALSWDFSRGLIGGLWTLLARR